MPELTKTVELRLHDLEDFIAWFEETTGKPFAPVAVTPPDVRDYRAYLQTVRQLKPNTVNRALSSLSTFFRFCQDQALVATNPCRKVRPVAEQPRPPRWLGHARLNTTAVYTQPGQADLRRAVEAVDGG
ncbi:MAG: phage integrase N-terminal SAM-like domain-containing protein [Anaerolineae bacterium]|jgi:integrase/recombinase XerC|nr:phage integrase N-terminal SAM-like domain-containing protein [Anaerolineae bacterium]MDH7475320.1 phage integrase N-terminal SAM-like domain-containing protein [Anaerolineae bacterium]